MIDLRETGNALLFVLTKCPHAERRNFFRELNRAIRPWLRLAIRSKEEELENDEQRQEFSDIWSNPKDYYKANHFVSHGTWSLLSMMLVSEMGLATRLPHIGHTLGQQNFHGFDLSITIPVAYKKASTESIEYKLYQALEDLRLSYSLSYSMTNSDKCDEVEALKESGRKFLYQDSTSTLLPARNSLKREHILSRITRRQKKAYSESKNKIDPEGLVCLFKLKINTNLKLKEPSETKKLFYITLILRMYEKWAEYFKHEDPSIKSLTPTYIRPLVCETFYYFVIVMRGPDYDVMQKVMDYAKSIDFEEFNRVFCAFFDHERSALKGLFQQETNPITKRWELFQVSYSIEGIPLGIVKSAEQKIQKEIEDCSKRGLEPDAPQGAICCQECNNHLQHLNLETLQNISGDLAQRDSLKSCKVSPSILISIKWGYYDYVLEVKTLIDMALRKSQEAISVGKAEEDLFDTYRLSGKYGVEVSLKTQDITLGEFVFIYAMFEIFLSQGCAPSKMKRDRLPLEGRQLLSPLLEIKTRFRTNIDSASIKRKQEIEYGSNGVTLADLPGENDFSPHGGAICLVNAIAFYHIITKAEDSIYRRFPDCNLFQKKESLYQKFQEQGDVEALKTHIKQGLFEYLSTVPENRIKALYLSFKDYLCSGAKTIQELESTSINRTEIEQITDICATMLAKVIERKHKILLQKRKKTPFQSYVAEFLRFRLKKHVTPETIELLLSSLLIVDSHLANPLSFHFIVDLRQYVSEFLNVLLTLHLEDNRDQEIWYWDTSSDRLKVIRPQRLTLNGIETWITNFVSSVEKGLNQVLGGILPYHDRNFSRLGDIRVFQTKKIIAASWMVRNILTNISSDFNSILEKQKSVGCQKNDGSPKKISLRWQKVDLKRSIPFTILRFGNTPEMDYLPDEHIIEISARNLTSIEGLSLIPHELGHIVLQTLIAEEDPVRGLFVAEAEASGIDYHSVYLKIKRSSNDRKGLYEALKSSIYYPNVNSHPSFRSQRVSYSPLEVPVYYLPTQDPSSPTVWEEIFADLFTVHYTFFGCLPFYTNAFKSPTKGSKLKHFTNTRHISMAREYDKANNYDFAEDFTLSNLLIMLRLPTITRGKSFCSVILRIVVVMGILKLRAKPNAGPILKPLEAVDLWDQEILPFFEFKLTRFFKRLNEQNQMLEDKVAKKRASINSKHSKPNSEEAAKDEEMNNLFITGFRIDSWLEIAEFLKDLATGTERQTKRNLNDQLKIVEKFIHEELKSLFFTYLLRYHEGIRQDEVFFLFINHLTDFSQKTGDSAENPETSQHQKNFILQSEEEFFKIRLGLKPQVQRNQDYQAALQLAGLIHLFFARMDSDYCELDGYLGYESHRHQQFLSRTRRIISTLIWEGALHDISEMIGNYSDSNRRIMEEISKSSLNAP